MDAKTIIKKLGGPSAAARFFECRPAAVSQWKRKNRIPPARLLHLKAARPDLFDLPTPPGTETEPSMAFGEFGEPRTGLDRRDDDRRSASDPDFGELGEPRDGDRRQEDRRRDCGETEVAA